jgi:hypothetical protein
LRPSSFPQHALLVVVVSDHSFPCSVCSNQGSRSAENKRLCNMDTPWPTQPSCMAYRPSPILDAHIYIPGSKGRVVRASGTSCSSTVYCYCALLFTLVTFSVYYVLVPVIVFACFSTALFT